MIEVWYCPICDAFILIGWTQFFDRGKCGPAVEFIGEL